MSKNYIIAIGLLFFTLLGQAQINQFEWGTPVGNGSPGVTAAHSRLAVADTAGNVIITNIVSGNTLTVGDTVLTNISSASTHMFTAKIDKTGHTEWIHLSNIVSGNGGLAPNGLSIDTKGDCYIVGTTSSVNATFHGVNVSGASNSEVFAIKVNNNGTLNWAKLFTGNGSFDY